MSWETSKREYEFTLVLDGVAELSPPVEDALFEAGCDDGTISLRSGRVFLTFARQAASLKDAIMSAIRDVNNANLGAVVVRVDSCDLVTQAEISRRLGRSRQLVHQYIIGIRGPGGFPPPVCEITDGARLWYWCEVARWLWEHDLISEAVMREAEQLAVINSVLELRWQGQIAPELTDEILRRIDASLTPACPECT